MSEEIDTVAQPGKADSAVASRRPDPEPNATQRRLTAHG